MLTIFGSIVVDTIHTPKWSSVGMLGGSSTYAALAAAHFSDSFPYPRVMGAVGTDMDATFFSALAKHADVTGMDIIQGRTFQYEAKYENDFETRTDMVVEPGVTADYSPALPDKFRDTDFVYLANSDPRQQLNLLEQFNDPKYTMCDTIQYWIQTRREDVLKVAGMVDGVILNEGEARSLAGTGNLVECARTILKGGARHVIIKKAEHGSMLFAGDAIYPLPGFPMDEVVDPTGAGDAFAGAVMGYLDSIKKLEVMSLRHACMYGNVLGSFAVSGRGIEGLTEIDKNAIDRRMEVYRSMLCDI